jgi:hypothetical protein
MHERLDVPEPPLTLVRLKVHERLVELVVTARLTVPLNPFRGATVTVEVPATFTVALTVDELTERAKS